MNKIQSYEMKEDEVPQCWLKPGQRKVVEALCAVNDISVKDLMVEQTLDWCRRRTDGYSELSRDMRKKLGPECDY